MLLVKTASADDQECGSQATGTNNQKKNGRQVIYSQITKDKLQLGQHLDSYRSQGRSSRKVYAIKYRN